MSPMPQPPPEHYIWLGRVMSACSMLELQVGLIGWAFVNGYHYTDDWAQVAGHPGAAWRLCESQLGKMSDSLRADVSSFLTEAKTVRDERNKFAHAVFTLDPTRPAVDQWVLRSARVLEFRPLSDEQGARLVAKANGLSQQASELRHRAAADALSGSTRT